MKYMSFHNTRPRGMAPSGEIHVSMGWKSDL